MTTVAPGRIGVVFVNYHSEALIAPRAASLLDAGFEVVVADNSGTYEGPGQVVATAGNVGFGGGCNAAVAGLGAEVAVAVLHNPDVDADPSVLRDLVARLCLQPRPGLLAPAIREEGGVRRHGFHWPRPRRETALALLEATGLQRWRRRRAPARGARPPEPAPPGSTFGTGAVLAVHLDAFRAVDGFDERFFLYLEDADLWWRVGRAGFDVGFEPSLEVRHDSGTGSPLGALDRAVLRWVGVELFAARHGRRAAWVLFRAPHVLAAAIGVLRGSGMARLVLGQWLRLRSPEGVATVVGRRHRTSPPG